MADTIPQKRRHIRVIYTDPDQAYFWTDEWQAGEREAAEQIEAGEGQIFSNGEEFLRALDPERAERDGT